MNVKRLILAIVAVFVGIWVSDFLIHGVWLKQDYAASMSPWRPEAEMQARMGWLFGGELLAAVTFVVLYARGFASMNCLGCACAYGVCMGLFSQAATLISYAVQPLPCALVAKWFVAGVAQGILAAVIVFLVYKPRPVVASPAL
ncbi:MAG: hypothetical protein QOD99_3050 [Chthoniobacter sp.]|jgi:hypothetical protein|nr:hypothetical protein [Chthoniobacter sp.]